MDLAQEKRRLEELDRYGVKTARQWNAYQAEWDRQHPLLGSLRRVAGAVLLWTYSIAFWTLTVGVPIYFALR